MKKDPRDDTHNTVIIKEIEMEGWLSCYIHTKQKGSLDYRILLCSVDGDKATQGKF